MHENQTNYLSNVAAIRSAIAGTCGSFNDGLLVLSNHCQCRAIPMYITTGYGAVAYNYSIGKYEVTLNQYVAFLNAVAETDNCGLYNAAMATDLNNGKHFTGWRIRQL